VRPPILRAILCAASLVLAAAPAPARADEQPVEIKDAPNKDVVENTCGACHSLDYIRMNSPFQSAAGWSMTLNKMIGTFHAPVEPEDAKKILDYLAKNYGS
jgi:cytochrome c5